MDGKDLKAWRDGLNLSQADAGDELGISRSAYASYESGRRPVPDEIAAKTQGVTEPTPREPKPKKVPIAGASPQQLKELAEAEIKQIKPTPPGLPAGSRRPTAQEIREHPHRYGGPDVWVVVYDPPERLKGGQTISRMILKGSASGLGGRSVQLVGTCSRNNPDREALAPGTYRPFRPALGYPLSSGPGPRGGQAKAAA